MARYRDLDPEQLALLQQRELEELRREDRAKMTAVLDAVTSATRPGRKGKVVHLAEPFLALPSRQDLPE